MEEPRIELLRRKKLIGKSIKMSLSINKTAELWQSFMSQKANITNVVGENLYSVQVYDEHLDFKAFSPTTEFVKWAAIEVSSYHEIPAGMEPFTLEEGNYAVFVHKGLAADFTKTFNYIFNTWLPKSNYLLDKRPHFEVLGSKYKNNDPSSEEEVWIPIRSKS